MGNIEILEQALKLKPDEKYRVVEGLLNSLDVPDSQLDEIWVDEAERRLNAYREGRLGSVSMEEIFGSDV